MTIIFAPARCGRLSYTYKPNMDMTIGVDLKSLKASYDATNSNVTHKKISLVSGVRFTF